MLQEARLEQEMDTLPVLCRMTLPPVADFIKSRIDPFLLAFRVRNISSFLPSFVDLFL